jgi:hypothetical protein
MIAIESLGVMAFQHERPEHPMKSIAAKLLPSSRFIEQKDAETFIAVPGPQHCDHC